MSEMDPLPGDPAALLGYTSRFSAIAEQIRDTSRTLQAIANDQQMVGQAIDAVRARVSEASSAILAAEPRYTETASALAEYAVKLEDAQDDADRAIRLMGDDADQLQDLSEDRARVVRARAHNRNPDDLADLKDELDAIDAKLDPLRTSVETQTAAYEQAEEDRDAAAEAAIARIQNVLERGADSFWDDLAGAWESFTDVLGDIAEWIWNVALPVIIDVLLVVELIVIVLGVVAVALVLLTSPLALPFLIDYLNQRGIDGALNDLIAAALVVLPQLSTGLQLLLWREANTPTPEIEATTPPGGLNSSSVQSYEDLFANNGDMDDLGGIDSTNVQIVEVINEDGTSSWRVTLPSTQDWELMNGVISGEWGKLTDQGGVNDLGSNLALMLTPEQEAAYQRMAKEAMADAGIGDNDSVMLVGWSQGGILAGRLACDPDVPGQVEALVVAGSPIDSMPIPSSVNVVSIQHVGDVVPMLDGTQAHPNTDNWVTVPGTSSVHGIDEYTTSAADQLDGSSDPQVTTVTGNQSQFFGEDERLHIYHTVE
jgi:hypothetical protein